MEPTTTEETRTKYIGRDPNIKNQRAITVVTTRTDSDASTFTNAYVDVVRLGYVPDESWKKSRFARPIQWRRPS